MKAKLLVAMGLGALLLWPITADRFWLGLATAVVVYAVAALGLDLIYGYGGMLSIGHAAFFGLGAYTVAIGGRETALTGWLLLVAAAAVAALAALVVGLIALRTTGFYFSLLTLAFALIFASLVKGFDWTGGPSGLGGVSRDLIGTGQLTASALYGVAVGVLLLSTGAVRSLRRSRKGRALSAIRTDPRLAAAMGVDVFRVKLQVFVVGCGLTGLAGGLFAQTLMYMSPEFVGLTQSVQFLVMVVIGGMGTGWGALAGAIVVRGLPEAVQSLRDWQLLGLGLLTLLVLVRFRLGVVGTIESWWRRRGHDRARAEDHGRAQAAVVRGTVLPVPSERPARPAPGEELLAVSGLGRRFGGLHALMGVDLTVRAGEVHALIGPNGAGKTTFLNVVTGVDRPTSGDVHWKGRPITRLPAHRRARLGMARTFQLVALVPDLTVVENMAVGAYPRTRNGILRGALPWLGRAEERALDARALAVLERLGLAHLAHDLPAEVPVGQRRLIEVGRALMADAELLLLDEPAAGLNETETNELTRLLRELRDEGTGILLIEHDMRLVMELSDRVTVLDFGVPLLTGTPAEVSRDDRVLTAYLGVEA